MTLETLKRKGRVAAQARDHHLGNFMRNQDGTAASAHCQHCNRWVHVNTHPLPNEIDIGGDAVALNCTGHGRVA